MEELLRKVEHGNKEGVTKNRWNQVYNNTKEVRNKSRGFNIDN